MHKSSKKPKHSTSEPTADDYYSIVTTSYRPDKPREGSSAKAYRKKRFPWGKILLLFIATILGAVLTVAVWDVHNLSKVSQKIFHTDNAWEVLNSQQLKTDDNNRTNILIVGYSVDDPGHGGAMLTDSILVLRLDKSNNSGYILSVPRDLYVNIPDYGNAKINEAYQAGEELNFRQEGFFDGGMGLLQKIIKNDLGIDSQYYIIVDYQAVREIVDALGGVEVKISSEDPRGIYDPGFPTNQGGPLNLPNGAQIIDGQTALRLSRARGLAYGSYGFARSDFNRTSNQRQILLAIKDKLTWELALNPKKNGNIFDAIGDNITTNVNINEVIPLYQLLTAIPGESLTPISLDNINSTNLLMGYTTPLGQDALIPRAGFDNFSEIRATLQSLN